MNCPKCDQALENIHDDIYANRYFCKSCSGFLINLALLRKITNDKFVRDLWLKCRDSRTLNLKCPSCNGMMNEVKVTEDLTLDLCMNCQAVWVDQLEEKQILITKTEKQVELLDEEAKAKIAVAISKMEAAKLMMKYPNHHFIGRFIPTIDDIEIAAGLKERRTSIFDKLDRRLFAFLASTIASITFFILTKLSYKYKAFNQDIVLNIEVAILYGIIIYVDFRVNDEK